MIRAAQVGVTLCGVLINMLRNLFSREASRSAETDSEVELGQEPDDGAVPTVVRLLAEARRAAVVNGADVAAARNQARYRNGG